MTEPLSHRPSVPMTDIPLDLAAFHQIHRPTYVRWSERYLGSRRDAEEAVDQTFEELARNWRQILTKESPAAYAWKVMKNRTIDYARARGRRPEPCESVVFDTADMATTSDPITALEGQHGPHAGHPPAVGTRTGRHRPALARRRGRRRDRRPTRHLRSRGPIHRALRPPKTQADHQHLGEPVVNTSLDDLLARARLLSAAPYTQADIDAGRRRLAARLAATSREGHGAPAPDGQRQAASDLTALCEALVAQPGSLDGLADVLAPSSVPEPHGARILGCLLALAAAQDSARFWWQYAAGAGDHPAAFCLAFYHESHGETTDAAW